MKTLMKTTKVLFGILTITTALAAQVQALVPFTNSLVAYYPFNGNADDATGHGNNGTIIGNVVPATDRFGNASNAYHFDGSNAAIEVTNTVFNIGQAGYTISGWFCSDNVSQFDQLIINSIPETGVGTEFNNTGVPGRVSFSVGTANGSWTDLGAAGISTNYANQTWYQLVLTKSGTNYTSYINGQSDCQQAISAASGYNANVGCIIGSINPINPIAHETFLGRLDDFRIYNRALSSNEVQQLYAYEAGPEAQAPFTNSLVAYYPFNGNADDATGHGNNGTIIGNVVPATDRFGNASRAYHFDGLDATIEVTNTLFNIGQEGYTISGWLCSDNVSQFYQLIFNTIPETGMGMELNNPNEPNCVAFSVGPANGTWTVVGAAGINTNYANLTWYQLVFTKSGTNYTSYINGQIDCQQTVSAASGYDYNVGCIIGSINPINPIAHETFLGRLDDFRIYNRALSSNEVQQLYAYESPPPPCIPYPATATVAIVNGFVVAVTVTDGGCGYTNVPRVLIVGGGGTGATATAVVSNGVVIGITVTDAGSGYTNAPTVYIASPVVLAGVSLGLYPGVTISGVVGYSYIIQATKDLSNTNSWVTLTNLTLTQPIQLWVDTNTEASLPANPLRFYQVLPGQ